MTWLSLSTPGAMCSTMGHNVCHPDSSEQRERGGRISHSFPPAKPLPFRVAWTPSRTYKLSKMLSKILSGNSSCMRPSGEDLCVPSKPPVSSPRVPAILDYVDRDDRVSTNLQVGAAT